MDFVQRTDRPANIPKTARPQGALDWMKRPGAVARWFGLGDPIRVHIIRCAGSMVIIRFRRGKTYVVRRTSHNRLYPWLKHPHYAARGPKGELL